MRKGKVVKAELLAPQQRRVQSAHDQLSRLVEEKVSQALAGNDAIISLFQSRKGSIATKREQTVAEQRKWTWYFEQWGCLICGTKSHIHGAQGMCRTCYSRIEARLRKIILDHSRAESLPAIVDTVRLAQDALLPSIQKLRAETVSVRTTLRGARDISRGELP